MTFSDIFKKSFLEGYSTVEMSTNTILAALLWTTILALYIYFCYRIMTRKSFYSKSFNIALVAMALLTAAIILTIQSSIVVSLGMVGALSIVRFRTAIKDPMDLVFLFWAISVGIICGAGLSEIALLVSLAVTLLLFVLDRAPVVAAPMILVVNGTVTGDSLPEKEIMDVVSRYSSYSTVKTTRLTGDHLDMVIELRVKDGLGLTRSVSALPGINSVSLLSHDNEKAVPINPAQPFRIVLLIFSYEFLHFSGMITLQDPSLLPCQPEGSACGRHRQDPSGSRSWDRLFPPHTRG